MSWTRLTRAALLSVLVVAVLAPAARAVTLVNPNGTPIGGQWQQWANEARVPTLAGSLIIVPASPSTCPAQACSVSPNTLVVMPDGSLHAFWSPTETQLAPNIIRWQLYWELGHQFDWAYLNATSRGQFLTLWGIPTAQWWDSYAGLNAGVEDGAEATFAGMYADCASGLPVLKTAGGFAQAPTAASTNGTCALISQIGETGGASMPPPVAPSVVPAAPHPAASAERSSRAPRPVRRARSRRGRAAQSRGRPHHVEG